MGYCFEHAAKNKNNQKLGLKREPLVRMPRNRGWLLKGWLLWNLMGGFEKVRFFNSLNAIGVCRIVIRIVANGCCEERYEFKSVLIWILFLAMDHTLFFSEGFSSQVLVRWKIKSFTFFSLIYTSRVFYVQSFLHACWRRRCFREWLLAGCVSAVFLLRSERENSF